MTGPYQKLLKQKTKSFTGKTKDAGSGAYSQWMLSMPCIRFTFTIWNIHHNLRSWSQKFRPGRHLISRVAVTLNDPRVQPKDMKVTSTKKQDEVHMQFQNTVFKTIKLTKFDNICPEYGMAIQWKIWRHYFFYQESA